MMLGGAGGRNKNIIDLLANSEALRASIDAHTKATEARLRSSEEHRKAKSEAEEIIRQLDHKVSSDNVRQQALDARQKVLDDLSGKLNDQIADYNFKHRNLEDSKAELARQKSDQQQILQRMTNDILAKDQTANQKHLHLEQQLMEAAKRHHDLSIKETSLIQRENEILAFANRLKGL